MGQGAALEDFEDSGLHHRLREPTETLQCFRLRSKKTEYFSALLAWG